VVDRTQYYAWNDRRSLKWAWSWSRDAFLNIQGLVHICGTYRIDADKWSATLRRFHAASRALARGARHAEASATTLNDDYATIDAHATQVNSERPRSLVAAILKIEKSRYLANGSIGLQKLWSDYAERVS